VTIEFAGGVESRASAIVRYDQGGKPEERFDTVESHPRGKWPNGDYIGKDHVATYEIHVAGTAPTYSAMILVADRHYQLQCSLAK
jgi:hypothetical protein